MSFEVRAAEVEELADGEPEAVALHNARRKAQAVAVGAAGRPVLAVDTLVTLDGRLYGQPAREAQARATLAILGGRTHTVVSGLCLLEGERRREGVATTAVTFRDADDALLDYYLGTGEWRGRAGAYAIQGRGALLVRRVEGDYSNVVGLPVALLVDLAPELVR